MATAHVIGAGLAGLSAALHLSAAGARVVLHEAAPQAGGRCRSYHDATLGVTIDNGNHLILSGNRATLAYALAIGAADRLVGPDHAEFPFLDLATGARWTIALSDGRVPWWLGDPARRVPGTAARDYLGVVRLLWAGRRATIGDRLRCAGPLYERLWQPLLLAALNTDPPEASAALAGAVMRETLAAGGRACRPLVASGGLSHALIAPALATLAARGADIRYGARLRAIARDARRATALEFDETVPLGPGDAVVLAVPAAVARLVLPESPAPTAFRAIVNAHFLYPPPAGQPRIVGVVGGMTEWVFAYDDRVSVTISGADRLLDVPREQLARDIWSEVAATLGVAANLPRWQIVKERRATFAATPAQDALRPAAATRWRNLALAGDWTQTGLPATIEGAIRSGERAASLALRELQ